MAANKTTSNSSIIVSIIPVCIFILFFFLFAIKIHLIVTPNDFIMAHELHHIWQSTFVSIQRKGSLHAIHNSVERRKIFGKISLKSNSPFLPEWHPGYPTLLQKDLKLLPMMMLAGEFISERASVCLSVCLYVCARERERERETYTENERKREKREKRHIHSRANNFSLLAVVLQCFLIHSKYSCTLSVFI